MDGDPTDNNALLFSQGYNGVLKAKFDDGSYVKVGEPAGTWTPSVAQTTFEQQFSAHPNINAVITPNDDNANAVIAALQKSSIPPKKFPTTGQDASLSGLQNILKGYQCGTVYKPINLEAQGAAAVALYLRAGKTPPSGLANGTTKDGSTDIQSVLLTPQWVTGRNMQATVIKDGAAKASEVCIAALASACTAAASARLSAFGYGTRRQPGPGCGPAPPRCTKGWNARGGKGSIVTIDVGEARTGKAAERPASCRAGEPLLSLRGINKHFGAVQALTDVDLDIPAGAVTALAGTTAPASRCSSNASPGSTAPTPAKCSGWASRSTSAPPGRPALGIETVHQDLALCDNLDIVQNMFLGRERTSHFMLQEEDMEKSAGATLKSLAVTTVRSIRQPVASLSGGQRQSVAIAKAVLWNSKLVIMDEPTAALGVAQTTMVLAPVRRLADRGLAVLLVSHNMNDVFQVADRVAVLRLGRMVAVRPTAEMDRQIVVDL